MSSLLRFTRAARAPRLLATQQQMCSAAVRRPAGPIAKVSLNLQQRRGYAAAEKGAIVADEKHEEELDYDEFTAKFEKEFDEAYDLFEVQRVLNNCFSYDLVPAPAVLEKALLAARRVNDYATASRVFEGLRHKVETKDQYKQYLDELSAIREELGITLHEELFGEEERV